MLLCKDPVSHFLSAIVRILEYCGEYQYAEEVAELLCYVTKFSEEARVILGRLCYVQKKYRLALHSLGGLKSLEASYFLSKVIPFVEQQNKCTSTIAFDESRVIATEYIIPKSGIELGIHSGLIPMMVNDVDRLPSNVNEHIIKIIYSGELVRSEGMSIFRDGRRIANTQSVVL